MGLIEDLWIMTDAGIVLFHRQYDEKLDDQLFGALLTALNSFAEELTKGGLSNLKVGDVIFYIKKEDEYMFVVNAPRDAKPKRVHEEIDNIIKSFFNTYPRDLLDRWDGEVDMFNDFENKITDNLKLTAERFQKAFW